MKNMMGLMFFYSKKILKFALIFNILFFSNFIIPLTSSQALIYRTSYDLFKNNSANKNSYRVLDDNLRLTQKNWLKNRYDVYVNNLSSILDGSDPALNYFGLKTYFADDYYWGDNDKRNGINNNVVIAVLDDGLKLEDWLDLENTLNINIMWYATYSSIGIHVVDSPYYLRDNHLEEAYAGHGVTVLSTLGTIARGINVVFIDLLFAENDYFGFTLDEAFKFLVDNGDKWGIDIVLVTTSVKVNNNRIPAMERNSSALFDKNYFMVVSSGNAGNKYNTYSDGSYFYPQKSPYWFTVSSIDYEDIGNYFDTDLYSKKNEWSGTARSSYLSASWGDTSYSASSIDWVMPGNQVPTMLSSPSYRYDNNLRKWEFSCGTSYSSPYLAGVVAVILDGYMDGYLAFQKTAPILTISKIKQILLSASSLSDFNYLLGYGFVNVHDAYSLAYKQGYLEAAPRPPGGIGPSPL